MFVSVPKSYQKKFSNFEPQIKNVIYILIVILCPVPMKVNFAAILDFFILSVTFTSGPLSYYK